MTTVYNPEFSAFGETHMRWVEDTAAAGLRSVGSASDLIRLDHTGWYLDNFQMETARGVVYQLPARNGREQFVYGYDDPWNDDAACLSFDVTDDKDDAARWADRIAERMADEAREDDAKFVAEQRAEEIASEVAETRREVLDLIAEIKHNRKEYGPKVCTILRQKISHELYCIRDLRGERDRITENPWEAVPGHC